MTDYECPHCQWSGDDPTDVESLDMLVCPLCSRAVEEATEDEPVEMEEPDDEDDDWEWNPTMRAGPGGPVIEPSDNSEYRNKDKQGDIL